MKQTIITVSPIDLARQRLVCDRVFQLANTSSLTSTSRGARRAQQAGCPERVYPQG